jgi:hypothetical protein
VEELKSPCYSILNSKRILARPISSGILTLKQVLELQLQLVLRVALTHSWERQGPSHEAIHSIFGM